MNIEQREVFIALRKQRMMMGLVAILVSYGMVFVLLGISYQPLLESSWGLKFSWALWDGDGWWKILLVAAVIFFSTMAANDGMKEGENIRQIFPVPEKDQPSIVYPSHLSEEMLVDTTLELAQKMEVEVAGIFVGEDPVPNAFTTFALGSGNSVFINSNLLMILDEQSVRAVIAHELGHIKNKDVLYQIGVIVPQQFVRLWVLLLVVQAFGVALLSGGVFTFFTRMLLVFGVFMFLGVCETIMSKVGNWYAQTKEKMADAYAVQYTSIEGMINGFLQLNDRSHTLKAFIAALKKEDKELDNTILQEALRIFPTGVKTQEEIEEKVTRIYAQAHMQLLFTRLRIEAEDETKQTWIRNMISHQKEAKKDPEAKKETVKKESKQPFVWRDFDWNHDGVLDGKEIQALVQVLRDEPTAMSDKEEKEGAHPPIRERILFLADLMEGAP